MPVLLDTFTSTDTAALRASNGITVALINNMPDAALEATERQFVDLLRASSSRVIVRLLLFSIPEVPRAEAVRQEMGERYRNIARLWDGHIDGLIVTGTEPRAANLKDPSTVPAKQLAEAFRKAHPEIEKVVLTGDTALISYRAPETEEEVSSVDVFVYDQGRWRALVSTHNSHS